jgi:hypothetical protein
MIDHGEDMVKNNKIQNVNDDSNKNNETTGFKWNYLKKTLTISEICSQSVLFMFAGSQTTADTLSFLAYDLALHPHYQEQLIDEIDTVIQNHVKKDMKLIYEY